MKIWLIILCMTLVTYVPRLLPLTSFDETALPGWVRRSLPYVPIAMLSALVGAAFLPSQEWLHYTFDARLLAGIVGIGIAWFSRNVMLTIGGGMMVLLILQ